MGDVNPAPTRNERIAAAIKEVDQKAPEAPKPEVKAAPEAPKPEVKAAPPPPEDKSFEKLTREKAAFRAEVEKMKPYMEVAKALDPSSLATLAKAKASGDPLSALSALGFSYADVANRMIDMGNKGKKPVVEDDAEEPESIAALRKEVEALKAERAHEQARTNRTDVMAKIKTSVPDKFKLTKALGEEDMILAYIENHHARTGSLPAETFDESVALAAEAVERKLAADAERWRRVLTPGVSDTNIPDEGSRELPSAGQGNPGKTLTNATTSPSGAAQKPESREEKLKALLADPNVPW